jgi:hypothetical protein
MSDPSPRLTDGEIERRALDAYKAVVGKVLRVQWVSGYTGSDSQDYHGEVIVRVDETDPQSICHWNGEWLDPYWDVTVLAWDGDGSVFPLRSCWMHGHSYNSQTGESQPTHYEVLGNAASLPKDG